MGFFGKSVVVSLIALWCFTSLVFTEELNHVSQAPAPSPYPHPRHHPKHPKHPHPHPKPPVKPPVPPPVKPPVPPVHPPAKPPVPPVKPPVYTPVKPPVKPPVLPPVKPPVPPVKPPVPPVKPPVYPPVKPPVKPPVLPPVKPPVKPPVPPVKPPVLPPAHPPVLPPVYPPKFNRSLVAVQGMVYCKDCKYTGVDTLLGAKPVKGAVVRFMCKGKILNVVKEATTDDNGYFFLLAPKTVTNYGFRGCTVKLLKSPNPKCSKASKLHGGDVGGVLTPVKNKAKRIIVVNNVKYGLFDAGPFAFEPSCPR